MCQLVLDMVAGGSTALPLRHSSSLVSVIPGTQLHIAHALRLHSNLTTVVRTSAAPEALLAAEEKMWVLFSAGRKAPKTGESSELSVSVQHFSPPDLRLLFWQRVISGVNPAERILLSQWLGGDTSGSGHNLPSHNV